MKPKSSAVIAFFVASTACGAAQASCYAAWSCSSSQCASVMGGYSGKLGPYASLSDCQAQSRRYIQTASCSCDASASSASSGGTLPGVGSMPGGLTPQQQLGMQLGVMGASMLLEGLNGNPEKDAQRQAEEAVQAAAAKRRAEEQDEKKEDARQRLFGMKPDGNSQSQLTLMGVKPNADLQLMDVRASDDLKPMDTTPAASTKPGPTSQAYAKGYTDASQCVSQNAGPYCAGAAADRQQACVADYRAGYGLGDKQRQFVMEEAHQTGRSAGARGELANVLADPRAQGSCRTEWVEAYNRGHFEGRQAKASR